MIADLAYRWACRFLVMTFACYLVCEPLVYAKFYDQFGMRPKQVCTKTPLLSW